MNEEPNYNTEFLPTDGSTHPFYAQFSDPGRAFWNMPRLLDLYTQEPDIKRPDKPDHMDYMTLAWDIAHRIPLGSFTAPGHDYSREFYARYTDEDGLIYVLIRFSLTKNAAEIARQPVLNSLVWLRIVDSWIDSTPEK